MSEEKEDGGYCKLKINYECPECGTVQDQEFDLESAESGEMKFYCCNCKFENMLSFEIGELDE